MVYERDSGQRGKVTLRQNKLTGRKMLTPPKRLPASCKQRRCPLWTSVLGGKRVRAEAGFHTGIFTKYWVFFGVIVDNSFNYFLKK